MLHLFSQLIDAASLFTADLGYESYLLLLQCLVLELEVVQAEILDTEMTQGCISMHILKIEK